MTMSAGNNPHRDDPVPSHQAAPAPPPLVTEAGAVPASEGKKEEAEGKEAQEGVTGTDSGSISGVTSGVAETDGDVDKAPRYKNIEPRKG
jgi:hypothetical protein